MADNIFNGTMKVKTVDGTLVPFYPKTNLECVYDYQKQQALPEIISQMKNEVEMAAGSGSIKLNYGNLTDSDYSLYSNETMCFQIGDYPSDEWVIVVDTRRISESNTITGIPFNLYGQSGITLTVNWGDGNTSTLTSGNYTSTNTSASKHTYSTPGEYEIHIKSSNWSNTYFCSIQWNYTELNDFEAKVNFLYYYKKTIVGVCNSIPGIKGVKYYSTGRETNPTTLDNSLFKLFSMCNLQFISNVLLKNCTNITDISSIFECISYFDCDIIFSYLTNLERITNNTLLSNGFICVYSSSFNGKKIKKINIRFTSPNISIPCSEYSKCFLIPYFDDITSHIFTPTDEENDDITNFDTTDKEIRVKIYVPKNTQTEESFNNEYVLKSYVYNGMSVSITIIGE